MRFFSKGLDQKTSDQHLTLSSDLVGTYNHLQINVSRHVVYAF